MHFFKCQNCNQSKIMHSLHIVGRNMKTEMGFFHCNSESATDVQWHDSSMLLRCFIPSTYYNACVIKITSGQQNIRAVTLPKISDTIVRAIIKKTPPNKHLITTPEALKELCLRDPGIKGPHVHTQSTSTCILVGTCAIHTLE